MSGKDVPEAVNMNLTDVQELSFPYSAEGLHAEFTACHPKSEQIVKVVTAKLHRTRAILIAVPVGADIPPVDDWGVHLIEHLAEVLGVRKDFIFQTPLFYRNHLGLLDALFQQHTLSGDGTIKRSIISIPLEDCDTHSVEQQIKELLPHFGRACEQALERALSPY